MAWVSLSFVMGWLPATGRDRPGPTTPSRVPQGAAAILGTVLTIAELGVAIALVPRPTAVWGAVGALVLLGAFVAGIANALRKGETPDCNCFGAVHSAPASRTTLARNVVLAGLAVVALGWGPGPAVDTWVADRTAAELVAVGLGIATLALLGLAIPTWRENRLLRRDLSEAQDRISAIPQGRAVGSLAPDFSLPDGHGGTIDLPTLLARGRPVALVFTVAGCGPCEPLVPELRRLQDIAADRLTVALVGISTIERYDRARDRHDGDLMLIDAVKGDPMLQDELDELIEVTHAYDVHDSPAAVIVTPAGTIGSPVVHGRPAIEALLRVTLTGAANHPGPPQDRQRLPDPSDVPTVTSIAG